MNRSAEFTAAVCGLLAERGASQERQAAAKAPSVLRPIAAQTSFTTAATRIAASVQRMHRHFADSRAAYLGAAMEAGRIACSTEEEKDNLEAHMSLFVSQSTKQVEVLKMKNRKTETVIKCGVFCLRRLL